MTLVTGKNNLLTAINRAWNELHATLNKIDPVIQTSRQDAQGWTIKDHLVHLMAWERSVLFLLNHQARHEGLGIEQNVYESDDENAINAVIQHHHADWSLDQVQSEFQRVHAELVAKVQTMSDDDLQKPYRFYLPDEPSDGDGPPVFNIIYGNTIHHYAEHATWLQEIADIRTVDDGLHSDPVISASLWAMQDARRRTFEVLSHVSDAMLDWHPNGESQTISTILYHIALIETDWLYDEVLGQTAYPADVQAWFPSDARNESGLLTAIKHETLDHHLRRLAFVREKLMTIFKAMTSDDFRRLRRLARYDVTPEWVLHHLLQHEAEHRAEINYVRLRYLQHTNDS